MWSLALYAGLRQGEALALRWRDVNLAAGLVNVRGTLQYGGKTVGAPSRDTARACCRSRPSTRAVSLPGILEAHRARIVATGIVPFPSAYVFAQADGSPMNARWILDRVVRGVRPREGPPLPDA